MFFSLPVVVVRPVAGRRMVVRRRPLAMFFREGSRKPRTFTGFWEGNTEKKGAQKFLRENFLVLDHIVLLSLRSQTQAQFGVH